ncbi:MAG: Crp/Fnr family transcriptional regulator [Proteobacteria bacterium]|nr:Crp/Fnr family transcriptional regulator [Pseudomonadota bacterium]
MTKHRNRLLAALPAADLNLLEAYLQPIQLEKRRVLEAPNRTIDYVYFPETMIASVVAVCGREERIEIGLIGCEGMTGMPVLMDDQRTPHSTYVQVEGEALRVESEAFRKLLAQSPSLHNRLLRFGQVFTAQIAQTALANGRAKLEQRLARWILMAHDRTVADVVTMTHEFLAVMLGVRRASVTVALDGFEKKGVIEARRGSITVVDRKAIERMAGHFYGVPEAEFKRLIA